jgi:hypothetical protein
MPNYKDGKVYRLDCLTTNKVYIGSTCCKNLSLRLSDHVSKFKRWKNGCRKNSTTSFQIIEHGNYKISLIELFPCDSKDELTARESHYIRTIDCINKVIPDRTKEEYRPQYYEKNKEIIKERSQNYREEHEEKLKEYFKTYRQEHADKIKKRTSITFVCSCGSTIQRVEKARHERSQKHQSKIS